MREALYAMVHRAKTSLLVFAGTAFALGGCVGRSPAMPPPSPAASVTAMAQAPGPGSAEPAPSALAAPKVPASALPVPPTPAPASAVASTKTDESWSRCHHGYKAATKDVSAAVAALARACEKATKMKLIGKTLAGKQADQDQPQSYPFDAKASHCYRVYAQAADGIKDLDLVVKDSAGVVLGEDSADDPSPVVLDDGAVCFTKDDRASVVVSVGMGSGAYAVQIWGD